MSYLFIVRGEISPRRAAWFEGLALAPIPGGYTALTGAVPDQAALHGILARIRDLGMDLVVAMELHHPESEERR